MEASYQELAPAQGDNISAITWQLFWYGLEKTSALLMGLVNGRY